MEVDLEHVRREQKASPLPNTAPRGYRRRPSCSWDSLEGLEATAKALGRGARDQQYVEVHTRPP